MFGAVEMLLERQARARLHQNPFDLVARAPIDALIIAPWAIDAFVLDHLAAFVPPELIDQRLHLVGFLAVQHHDGIGSRHHDDILEPHDRRQHLGRICTLAGLQHHAVAANGISPPRRSPRSQRRTPMRRESPRRPRQRRRGRSAP